MGLSSDIQFPILGKKMGKFSACRPLRALIINKLKIWGPPLSPEVDNIYQLVDWLAFCHGSVFIQQCRLEE